MSKVSGPLWPYNTPGIPDPLFTRGNVPMSKEETRALAICKARLPDGGVIYDIGAGTGSISVEAALRSPLATVYAIEMNAEAVELIGENCAKFGLNNVEIKPGEAPAALAGLPDPDRVIIGGSRGFMKPILEEVWGRLKPGGRIVADAVLLETLEEVNTFCREKDIPLEIIQVTVARSEKIGPKNFLKGLNPVYIMTMEKEG